MILARDDVFIKERTDLRYWDESTRAEVSIKSSSGRKHSSVIIACLYRPPTADTIQFGDAIETALNKLSTSHPVILTCVDAETSLSLSLQLYLCNSISLSLYLSSPPLHFILTLTFGQ